MDSQAKDLAERRSWLGWPGRRGRHPIRSAILVAIAAALATIALVVLASGNPAAAASSLTNGNFEAGDLRGWSVDSTNGGYASATIGHSYPFCSEAGFCGGIATRTMWPQEGSYFALLTAGYQQSEARISQPFEASNGDKVSGWVFVNTDSLFDYSYDLGQVVITNRDSGTTVATPFEEPVGTGGYPYWKYWEYTFTGLTGTATFRTEARLQRSPSSTSGGWSVMGLDDVRTSASTNAPDTTKPSTSATRSVQPNEQGWNKENVAVTLNATDNRGGSGVEKITYSASGAQAIARTDAPGNSVDVTLDREGTTTLSYHATDKAGNAEDEKSLTVKIDKKAPTGTVSINDGASSTRSRSVTLKLSATDPSPGSGVARMRIANTQSGLTSATWEPYATTRAWTLTSGMGTKTVYVQYGDAAGNVSAEVTDTIKYR